ncbi:MAG: D-glycero-beta-D-manno-heptose-7-phosphate kinase [Deltaproteobacteria bacterium]|nr:D-glycero-beta-D-manno-heptose-7-phosphate kinase [Deltaproteobacteria bacterium]
MRTPYTFDRSALAATVDSLAGHRVLLVGDIMLDEYLEGDAERISPEAPIPVVKVARSRLLLGGAGNVARNIATLGGKPHLVSVCGDDAKGEVLRELLGKQNIAASVLPLQTRPTTLKTRVIARNQQMLRIDQEESAPLRPDDTGRILEAVGSVIDDFSVLVVSDYGKGVITPELMGALAALREKSPGKPRILVDPKTPNYPLYAGAYIMTPNTKETSEAAGMPVNGREEILEAGKAIMAKLRTEHLLTTLGSRGMALFLSQDEVWHIPTAARKVFDVTGAGDTVMATLALCLAAGVDLLEACILANYAAGMVVADVGASTVAPQALRNLLEAAPEPGISRW